MSRSIPIIEVSVNGQSVSAGFYKRLISATITDAPGQNADTCELTFDDANNEIEIPQKGAKLTAKFGFEDAGTLKMGVFSIEKSSIEGGEDGELVKLSGRSADMREDIKEPLSEHFDDTTVKAIVEELAGRHGFAAKVDDEYAGLQVDYMARANQSSADFLTRLADNSGALFSIKDGKFLFLKRGGQQSFTIEKNMCESWSFSVEPRPQYANAEAGWFERETGKTHFESFSTGLKGPLKRVRTLFNSKAEAAAKAKSEGERMARSTGSGTITLAGMPELMADMPLILVGFRPEANGEWRAGTVTHTYDDTYKTSVTLEAPEKGKQ